MQVYLWKTPGIPDNILEALVRDKYLIKQDSM